MSGCIEDYFQPFKCFIVIIFCFNYLPAEPARNGAKGRGDVVFDQFLCHVAGLIFSRPLQCACKLVNNAILIVLIENIILF